jgi:hypothetical protein
MSLVEGPYSFPALAENGEVLVVTNTSTGEIKSATMLN